MRYLKRLSRAATMRHYGRIKKHLRTVSPKTVQKEGEARALKAFERAADKVPAYRKILKENGVKVKQIKSIGDFKERVPILTKRKVFQEHKLRDVCVNGNVGNIRTLYSSSGQTGVFSYGVETKAEAENAGLSLEFALSDVLDPVLNSTILINCLPMGVEIHTNTVPVVRSSVREDIILSIITKLKGEFAQLVIVGEQLFLKKLFEKGVAQNVGWKDYRMAVVTGAEYVAESTRTYFASLLGIDLGRKQTSQIVVNYGLSELSSSIARESWETVQIRRLARKNKKLYDDIYGKDGTICAPILQFNPYQNYIETVTDDNGHEQMVVSMLEPRRKIPLIRYNTGDSVRLIEYEDFEQILVKYGRPDLVPPYRLPFAVMWGRFKALELADGEKVYPECMKEALYADFTVAESVTGNFRIQKYQKTADKTGDAAEIIIQLCPGVKDDGSMYPRLRPHVHQWLGKDYPVRFIPYYQFPFGMTLDYERKPKYL